MAHGLRASLLPFGTPHASALLRGFASLTAPALAPGPIPGTRTATCVPTVLSPYGAGISTCCPSATPHGLALGPDSPRADQLYPGILGYPAWGIHTPISLLIPAFSLPGSPRPLSVALLPAGNAPLPCPFMGIPGFGGVFEPRAFSAQDLSTSELLRTL